MTTNTDPYSMFDTITITSSPNASSTSQVYTTPGFNGTGGYTYATTATNNDWITLSSDLTGDSLEVKGNANFHGDLKLQGKSLKDSLDRIEERLAILRPNEELEEKWEQLRGLRKMYMELEKEILEKQEMWNILKK